jgi:hypothetical protein
MALKGRIPTSLLGKIRVAPGARPQAVDAVYGIPPRRRVDWGKVTEICGYMAEGFSRPAAVGKANVTLDVLRDWELDFPAVREELGKAKLRRLALLEEGLLNETAKMPQIVARIFALKNADPSEWKENPANGPVVPGLQQNITIITGVPEAPAAQTIEHQAAPALEVMEDADTTFAGQG